MVDNPANPETQATPTQKPQEQPDPDRERFEVELEFVQCLANPSYLNFLAQNEYFDSPEFIAYLKYLQYWRTPEYAKFIVFPHSLYFLHLLQETQFRDALKRVDYSDMIHEQQGYHWQFEKTMKLRSETMNGSSGPEKADPAPELANTGQGNDPKQPTQQPPQPVAPLVKKPPPSETRLTRSPRPNIPKPAS